MSKIVQHPEKLDSRVDFLNVAVRKAKLQHKPFLKRKQHWEQEERPTGLSIPVVSSLPSSGSNGDLVYCNGLYIFSDGWQRIDQPITSQTVRAVGGVSQASVLLPEPEAVYATRAGGGAVYVAISNSGRLRTLVFEAPTQPASDASASFAMNAGRERGVKYNLSFIVNSNQSNRTLSFRVYTDNIYDFPVAVDSNGFGVLVLEIGGSEVITVTRRYTEESGLVYPCWTACGFVVFK
jgi:hypothetical protein